MTLHFDTIPLLEVLVGCGTGADDAAHSGADSSFICAYAVERAISCLLLSALGIFLPLSVEVK
jgi:hypothetical protein